MGTPPETPVAELRVRGEQGVFIAKHILIRDGLVYVTGRWRWRTGADWRELRFSDEAAYSWPTTSLERIRWLGSGEAVQ